MYLLLSYLEIWVLVMGAVSKLTALLPQQCFPHILWLQLKFWTTGQEAVWRPSWMISKPLQQQFALWPSQWENRRWARAGLAWTKLSDYWNYWCFSLKVVAEWAVQVMPVRKTQISVERSAPWWPAGFPLIPLYLWVSFICHFQLYQVCRSVNFTVFDK